MPLFLLTVAGISLSGVMMPGPVLAATIARSWKSKFAGSFVAIGHGIVEIPLILLIYFGFHHFFQNQLIKAILGLSGGAVLIYMGKGIFNLRKNIKVNNLNDPPSSGATIIGAITSLFNPYFVLWWVTVGTTLISRSIVFGLLGFVLLILIHWLCDFSWYSGVSLAVHHSGKAWGEKVQLTLLGVSSLLLLAFGVWFIISSLNWIM